VNTSLLKPLLSVAAFGVLLIPASLYSQQSFRDANEVWGPRYQRVPVAPQPARLTPPGGDAAAHILHWNQVAVDASGLDHTPVAPGENRVYGEQLGPCRASRAIAIVQIAVYEAVNGFDTRFRSYVKVHPPHPGASMDAAIAQAAHDTLVVLFPSQKASFDQELANDLNLIPHSNSKNDGVTLGANAAAAILALRTNDGSQVPDPQVNTEFVTSNAPGKWRQDPVSHNPLALGAYWGQVKPFVLKAGNQFRAPVPPALTSAEYATAYSEAKSVGGDGVATPTTRTAAQTQTAIFWAYDGTPSLCAPPRLYNQIIVHLAQQLGTTSDPAALARLLALTNTAMADTAIAVWESKYFYQYWRPVIAIRESDAGTGPSGLGDGNPNTAGDVNFMPLGAPASNLNGPNFTPPFPSYPSGHGGFGGALFESLRNFYGTDNIAFTFVSDEFNGITKDNTGTVRPLIQGTFSSLSQAEEDNGQSRIYLGIHWKFDKTEAIAEGRRVADFVFANAFTPVGNGHKQ
jgi:hypothetical protein